MAATLLSINIGAPEIQPGTTFPTGINKVPRSGPVMIDTLGVLGDAVMDRKHHGGVDQAVYLYLQSDYDWWGGELGETPAPGTFGENLTIAGVDGVDLAVGDRFRIEDVLIEVTSHRTPCNTLARRMGSPLWVRRFHRAGRPGAYCRVLSPGIVETGMAVGYAPYSGEKVTVRELMSFDGLREVPVEAMRRVLRTPVHYKMRADFEAALARR